MNINAINKINRIFWIMNSTYQLIVKIVRNVINHLISKLTYFVV